MSLSTDAGGAAGPLRRAMETIRSLREQLDALRGGRRVAIVGAGLRAPGGVTDLDSYWSALTQGRDLTGDLPAQRREAFPDGWEDVPQRGGWLDDVLGFDAKFFGLSPRESRALDPQHRLLLEVVWEAFEDAALPPGSIAGSTGVYTGITWQDYRSWAADQEPNASSLVGVGHCFAAGRLAYTLNLRGPALAVDTACSSALVALHTACRALAAGDCDVAVAAGVNLILSPRSTLEISLTGALSPDGRCRPFDARANGFVRGEACAAVVLKRLDDAVRDGDRILAVVEGSGVNQDGQSSGFTAPNVAAQTSLITSVLASAGLTPADIGYLETHGTGTPLGDPIELEAAATALGRPAGGQPLYLGSTKANIGHTEAAAGLLGLLRALLCLRHRQIPPQAQFDTLNPRIDLAGTGMTVPTSPQPWSERAGRCAAVSSFGMSGTNAHVVLSAAPPPQPVPARPVSGFAVSAATPEALAVLAGRYADQLATVDADGYAAFAYTATHGRSRLRHTVWVKAADPGEARAVLATLAQGKQHPAAQPLDAAQPLPADESGPVRAVTTLPTYPWQRRSWSTRERPR